MSENTHTYIGRFKPERRGQQCRLLNTWRGKGPHNVQVEFSDGYRMICPIRCLRRLETQ